MLKDTSLCMGCMNEKGGADPCKLCGYSDLDPHIPTYLEPKTFLNERYIVGRLLSYNGEGAIYIGYDTVTASKVTIKEFMPDTLCTRHKGDADISVNANNSPLYKTYLSEFADLNRSLMKLRGMAHIQAVLDVFYANNTCYAVFEFINGISLKTYLANSSGGMTWEQVKELFPPIFTTLSLAHAAGIIHRGISTQTIFVTDKMELKLSGFAITAARTTGTEIACEIYSGFAAPEQYSNEPNGTWTDVYGISAVLYKVLTGANPPEAIARAGGMLEPSLVNINVPQNVSKVVMGGMKLNTDNRIRTVTELVDKLFAPPVYSGGKVDDSGRPISRREEKRIQKQKQERIKFLTVIIAVGLVLITFAIVFALTLSGACDPNNNHNTSDSGSTSIVIPGSSTGEDSASSDSGSGASSDSDNSQSGPLIYNLPDFTDNYKYESAVRMYGEVLTLIPEYGYTDDLDAGFIFYQSIEPGTPVPSGTEVNVKVSMGRRIVDLPNYGLKTADDYIAELAALGIKYDSVDEGNNILPEGNVLRCTVKGKEILPGEPVNVEEGETVIVYVAKTERVILPDLTDGRMYETAKEQYEDSFVLVAEYEYNDKYAQGIIFGQYPGPGEEIIKGTVVTVRVSRGSSIVSLPDYESKQWTVYKEALDALGIKYNVIEVERSDYDNGVVFRCNKGLIEIKGGDPVNIEIKETVMVYVAKNN